MKKIYSLLIFDLDGTLARSKAPVSEKMADTLETLLEKVKIAVISGGSYIQYQKQFLPAFKSKKHFPNLYLLPTSGTCLYTYSKNTWKLIYEDELPLEDREKIITTLEEAIQYIGLSLDTTYGPQIEDRKTQITFSGLGQEAPVELKQLWDPDQSKRLNLIQVLSDKLPEFDLRIGGSTSIDITRKGRDKAYGINKLLAYSKIPKERVLFIGDALFPGGNDYPVTTLDIECKRVSGPDETLVYLNHLIDLNTES